MVPRSFGKNPSSSRQPLFSFFPSSTTVVIFLDLFFLSFVYTPYIEWCLIHLSRSLSLSSCDTPWLHPPPPPPPPLRHPSCFSSVLSTRRPLCFYYFVDRRTSEKETIPKDKKTKKKKKKANHQYPTTVNGSPPPAERRPITSATPLARKQTHKSNNTSRGAWNSNMKVAIW